MLKNYLKIAWRHLLKDKQFTLLNLMGLSSGLACVLLITLWVDDQLRVDKFNTKDSQLYEVLKKSTDGAGAIQVYKNTQGLLAKAMAEELPEVECAVPVRRDDNISIISFDNKHIKTKHEFAGKDFFNLFSYPCISGSSKEVAGVSGLFLSEDLALRLFNTTAVIGRTVDWDYKHGYMDFSGRYTVAGVYKTPPNASEHFDILLPFDLYAKKAAGGIGDITFWGSNMVSTYVVLKKATDIAFFNNKIKDFTQAKIRSLYASNEDTRKYEGSLFVRRFSDGYLYNNYVSGERSGGRIEYVHLFSVISIFILVIACINFMNLSTAKAAGRMKEVGIRKVIGAPRWTLVLQYIGESMVMSFLSIALAIVLASLMLPVFREITGKELTIRANSHFILSAVSMAIITGIIAGSYPAIYLSGFRPIMVLKGKLRTSAGESWVRKGLVVFQFTISVVLIIAVTVVYQQMKLIQTKNLGYDKDHIIRFPSEGKLNDNPKAFLAQLRNIPGVISSSSMEGDLLGNAGHGGGGIDWEGKGPNVKIEFFGVSGDYGYMELLGLRMAQGRSFSEKFGSDSSSVIFNESAIAAMRIKDPIGKTVSLWGRKKQIIGVAKDFHFESLYKKVGPAFLECSPKNETFLVRIKAGAEAETIARLSRIYKSFNQGLPFDYKFLDEDYQAMYASEQKVAILSRYFATFAIIISCLGLFGLAAFTAQKRQKEIGIRKVVGASVQSIISMLSIDFLKLVLLAVLIAFPLAWWTMDQWLQSFAYRVTIGTGVFLITGASILLITLVTVSLQAIKAAIINPVKSLRTE